MRSSTFRARRTTMKTTMKTTMETTMKTTMKTRREALSAGWASYVILSTRCYTYCTLMSTVGIAEPCSSPINHRVPIE
eukprot:441147-Prymnesium_polylepis.1